MTTLTVTPAFSAMATSFDQPGTYRIGGITAIALHTCAIAAVFLLASKVSVAPSAPIMVSMITAQTAEPLRPEPEQLPKPRPVRTQSAPSLPQPLLASAKQDDAPADEAPAPQAPPPPPAATASAEAAPAVAVIPPRFDAAYLDNPAPSYPPLSRRMGEQGKVLLRVLVNADGSAARVELRNSSGSPRLDQSALDTVKRWRFISAKQGTQAISAWVLIPILFTLGD